MSLANLMYLVSVMPFQTDFANRIEIFNELTVLMISEITTTFLDRVAPIPFKAEMGWCIIFMAAFNIFANIVIVAVSSIQDLYLTIKESYHEHYKMARRKRKLENWANLYKGFPEKF